VNVKYHILSNIKNHIKKANKPIKYRTSPPLCMNAKRAS
jgi:hypothetical protein